MKQVRIITGLSLLVFLACLGCSSPPQKVTVFKTFPLNGKVDTITKTGVTFDKNVSSDGKGSLKITATGPTVVRLFETGDLDIDNGKLIYQAALKTKDVQGNVYLEMYCHFLGKGEFFSRSLQSPITGTTDWTTEETPFYLKKGENPDNIKLNLIFTSQGTAWIDNIKILKTPWR